VQQVISSTRSTYHGGAGFGFNSALVMYPELGFGVVILTNSFGHKLNGYQMRQMVDGVLLAERGLDAAIVDAISLAAGFAKGTLYNYFDSKEQLFAAVIEESCRRAVTRYGAAEAGNSVRERLQALAAADVAVLREEEGFMKVLVREAMSFRPETFPLILEHLTPFVAKVSEILEEGIAAKQIRNDRPIPELAVLFVGILSLMFVQHWGTGGAWPPLKQIPDVAVTTFLDGAARSAPSVRRAQ
jgi:AcrR family transcriptional regulator